MTAVSVVQYEAFKFNYLPMHQRETFAIIGVTSVIALVYNVVHSLMIQQTSAVTTTVLGEAKIVGLMVLSYLLLGMPFFPVIVTYLFVVTSVHLHAYEDLHILLTHQLLAKTRMPCLLLVLKSCFPCRGEEVVHAQHDAGLCHCYGGLFPVLSLQVGSSSKCGIE